ncbi:hypothetical protein ACHAW5_000104 [Stephanodiscus triporus]|uniref:K Homology domain-containing protein n=1 Tax=Stephanodiscus triporus TaxID=2934178 RepID=A0ABD3N735_9STRA
MEALPPAPVDLLSLPPDGASTFEPPPLAVLPGDDLTRFILRDPPHPSSSSSVNNTNNNDDVVVNRPSPSPRTRKKSRSGKGGGATAEDDKDEDHPVLPHPKIGTGLVVIRKENDRPSRGAAAAAADDDDDDDDDPLRRPPPSSVVVCIRATVAGRLVYRPSSRTWYVASNPRRYHPTRSPLSSSSLAGMISSSSTAAAAAGGGRGRIAIANVGVGDRVIGIVEDQRASADYYRVNVFGSHPALLHVLGFEGATKRNRPTLEPGSLVYCRVVRGFGGGRMDGEVSCKVGGGGGDCGKSMYNCNRSDDNHRDDYDDDDDDGGAARKDWMTNEGTYGPLVGGTSFRVPLGLARELLLPKNAVLDALDKSGVPFEIAVGTNGVVWVNAPEPRITIMIVNAIKNSEVMAEDLVRGMVKIMVKNVKKESDDLM